MKIVTLPTNAVMPALGLGTWRMGERADTRGAEVSAVRLAIDIGYRLIDTAEMYGDGGAEEVVGAAVREALASGVVRRDDLYIVTKVYPHHASRAGVVEACERSLRRLGLDYVDLYLLHWREQLPLGPTVEGFELLQERRAIRHWGVSNFDMSDMDDLWRVPGGSACAANQVYYSVSERGIEFDLLPWQRERHVPTMAYCPIDRGVVATSRELTAIAAARGATAAQVALAWAMRQPDVMAIPKAVRADHLRENFAAADIHLTADELAQIDRLFPPPTRKHPLTTT